MSQSFDWSVYRQYKSDTNSIAVWLTKIAKEHGFNEATLRYNRLKDTPQKLKGRERKLMRDANKNNSSENQKRLEWYRHKLQAQDFLDLAQFIAKHTPPIEVPFSFIAVLDRTVTLRSMVRDDTYGGVEEHGIRDNGHTTHDYFIKVLEQVREILRPCLPRSPKRQPVEPQRAPTIDEAQLNYDNMFTGLPVEEPSENGAQEKPSGNVKLPEKPREEKPVQEKTLDEELAEADIAVSSLFEDYSRLRASIIESWEMYRDGKCDLVSASLTTNVALELARYMQEQRVGDFKNNGGFIKLYQRFLSQRFEALDVTSGADVESEALYGQDFNIASELYMPTFIILRLFYDQYQPGKVCVTRYPVHTSIDRSSMSPAQKQIQDVQILLEILPQIGLEASGELSGYDFDEISRAILGFLRTDEITAFTLLAVQVYLDIRHTLGEKMYRCFKDLQRMAKTVTSSVKKFREVQDSHWPRPGPGQKKNPDREAYDKHLDTFISRASRAYDDGDESSSDTEVEPGPDDASVGEQSGPLHVKVDHEEIWKYHPLMCGMEAYAIKVCFHNLGYWCASIAGIVIQTAHLYNAVRQEQLLEKVWTDMELLFRVQDTNRLLLGKKVLSPEQYYNHFIIALGGSAQNFAANRRNSRECSAPFRDARELQQMASVTIAFSDRYVFRRHRNVLMSGDIEAIIRRSKHLKFDDSHGLNRIRVENSPGLKYMPRTVKSPAAGSHIDLTKLISQMRDCFISEAPEIAFDYFNLFRQCCSVLKLVDKECGPMVKELGAPPPRKMNPFLDIVEDVFGAMMTDCRAQATCCKCRNHKPGKSLSQDVLAKAADVLAEVVETRKSSAVARMAENVYGLRITVGTKKFKARKKHWAKPALSADAVVGNSTKKIPMAKQPTTDKINSKSNAAKSSSTKTPKDKNIPPTTILPDGIASMRVGFFDPNLIDPEVFGPMLVNGHLTGPTIIPASMIDPAMLGGPMLDATEIIPQHVLNDLLRQLKFPIAVNGAPRS